jgi:drug/metabolite transporter (DMT)-like permease
MSLVGAYVGLSKVLLAAFPVFLLAFLRFALAAVAMAGWLQRRDGDARLSPGDRRLVFWCSFLGNFLFSLSMLHGIALSSAVAAGVIMAAIPAAVAAMSRVFLGERLGWRAMAGIACAVAGIALLTLQRPSTREDAPGAQAWLGNLLLFAAVLCEASYVVIGKRLTKVASPQRISALINAWGLALTAPFGLWAARTFDFAGVEAPVWALLGFYAVAASILSVWLWMTGLKRVPSSVAGVFTVFLPISAAGVGVVFVGEPFTALHAVALALALAGVALASLETPSASVPLAAPGSAPSRR